jgi:hypothetical protein
MIVKVNKIEKTYKMKEILYHAKKDLRNNA